jgi:hypothetical protein
MRGGVTIQRSRRAKRSDAAIESLEAALLPLPQLECPPSHRFVPGAYVREVTLPKGGVFIGHRHKQPHLNVLLCGSATVVMDGQAMEVRGPVVFASKPGVRKVVYVSETMVWQTIHTTNETDVKKLEAQLIEKSRTFKAFEKDVKRLKELCLTSQ